MTEVDAVLARLAEGTLELFWDFDSRFDTAVGRVSAPDDAPLLGLLDECFPHNWDHQSIDGAPDVTRAIADSAGGLRPGQRLWTLDPADSPLLYAAWWPWGSGTTFSLRVGCIAADAGEQQALTKKIRSLFGA
jgi:hypothetical protein